MPRYDAQYDVGDEEQEAAAARLGIKWRLSDAERSAMYRARQRGELPPVNHVDRVDLLANTVEDPLRPGCRVWARARSNRGYGKLKVAGEYVYAHRLSLERRLGRKLQDGCYACHTCDNPPCINPDHLFEGTSADNAADKMAKGRWRGR